VAIFAQEKNTAKKLFVDSGHIISDITSSKEQRHCEDSSRRLLSLHSVHRSAVKLTGTVK
jgi:hypothetical protein